MADVSTKSLKTENSSNYPETSNMDAISGSRYSSNLANGLEYYELHTHSAYSFLRGANEPEDLVKEALKLGISGMALTDYDGFPGVVKFAKAAKNTRLRTIFGSELKNAGIVILARNVEGYRQLSNEISKAFLKTGKKGAAHYSLAELAEANFGNWQIISGYPESGLGRALSAENGIWALSAAETKLRELASYFGSENVAVELNYFGQPRDWERAEVLQKISEKVNVRTIVANNVYLKNPHEYQMLDLLRATDSRKTVDEIYPAEYKWGGFLRSQEQMSRIFRDYPSALENVSDIGARCTFDFSLVKPQLPDFNTPSGYTESSWLAELVYKAAARRYGDRGNLSSESVRAWAQIDYELQIIDQCGFPGYFLIVHDIVEYCRRNNIWCQGRGSAANSAVCFVLGITAVDAVKHKMLFERFLSPDRVEAPDIDIDIEAKRREEVIQYVYRKYGRNYAAQVANVVSYRRRSAIKDTASALGYGHEIAQEWTKECESSLPREVMQLSSRMRNIPRHFGIHSGGMVICKRPVVDYCPVSWAAKPGRSVLQWDKDDCAEIGLVKFDLLGLGMLTALKEAFASLAAAGVRNLESEEYALYNLPQEDLRVFDLLCAADTVGVFQVESRAQINTLPRLAPRTFYDIVIEVALIRPGPIQGNSVNPYLRRRRGSEPVTYLHELMRPALEKTLGVPLFQEQLMQIAVDVAGFTPAQADQLRKAMGSKRHQVKIEALREEFFSGMTERGIDRNTGEEIFEKIKGFAEFGFPESHAFSFAYLVYASSWLKVYYPEHFYLGLLKAQPLGFYSVQSLLNDAKRHGVRILPIDVNYSCADSVLEKTVGNLESKSKTHPLVDVNPLLGIRLGLSNIKGLSAQAITTIVKLREEFAAEFIEQPALGEEPVLREGNGAGENDGESVRKYVEKDGAKEHFSGCERGEGDDIKECGLADWDEYFSESSAEDADNIQLKYRSLADFAQRCQLSKSDFEKLAKAGAFGSITANRRQALWESGVLSEHGKWVGEDYQPIIPGIEGGLSVPSLPQMHAAEVIRQDYSSSRISVEYSPLAVYREDLKCAGVLKISDLKKRTAGTRVKIAGVVTHRQRPHTAGGITFISLEDETGLANIVCSVGFWGKYREVGLFANALIVRGIIERDGDCVNIIADKITNLALGFSVKSRDFR